jgi:hypothetical protein
MSSRGCVNPHSDSGRFGSWDHQIDSGRASQNLKISYECKSGKNINLLDLLKGRFSEDKEN